jgi:pyroglutamyl-peptidase
MLRRRRKTSASVKRTPHSAPLPSRRRARPDAPVPPELRLDAPGPAIVTDIVHEEAPATPSAPRPARSAPRTASREGVVLVTGFEPFGGETSNPSWDLCKRLPETIAGLRVETCRVPCRFRAAIEAVAAAIERLDPVLVVCLGQAGGRAQLSVERVAINVDDARIEDNSGARPIDEPIASQGPPAYFATLPVKAMAAAMRSAGVPAEVSNTAGTFVCNHLMYGVLHYLAASGRTARAGFIHVPFCEEQVLDKPGVPSMSLATMARGVEAAVAAACRHATDIRVSEGRLD